MEILPIWGWLYDNLDIKHRYLYTWRKFLGSYALETPLTFFSFLCILRLQQKPQESSVWHACKWLGKLSSSCQSSRISLSYSFILWCPSSGKFSNSSTGFVNSTMIHPLSPLEHIQWRALGINKAPLT